jgi:Ca2+-dependent lipid-binding protein
MLDRELSIADNDGANDPFVKVKIGHVKGKTKVVHDSNDPMWYVP